MMRLFDVVFDEKYSFKHKLAYLESCSLAGSFIGEDSSNTENVTKKIKALLSVPATRNEGLALLHVFLPQCSAEIFARNANYWMQSNLRIIQERSSSKDKRLACSVLVKIIPLVASFPELAKSFATSTIPSLVESLLKITPEHEWKDKALPLLETCLTCFPGPCGSLKFQVEKFVIKYLDQWQGNCLKYVTSCVALIPFLGGGGTHGINHSSSWLDQAKNILNSMNHLVDALYDGGDIAEGALLVLNNEELPQPVASDPLLRIFQISKLYEFLGLCFVEMMSKQTSVAVKVPVELILTHICKALSINIQDMAEKPAIDAVAIASVLPTIHLSCLRLLEILICSLRKHLMPQAKLITDLLLQTLNWSVSDITPFGFERPYSHLRTATYRVMKVWAQILGCGSGLHLYADQLFNHIAHDIKPQVDTHKLQSKPSTSEYQRHQKKKKKKSQKELDVDEMLNDTNLRKVNEVANKETVVAALQTLEALIYSCGPSIEVEVWKDIILSIVELLLQVQQQSWKSFLPYSNPPCRIALYEVMKAVLLGYNAAGSPTISKAIAIFSYGQDDHDEQVAYSCRKALAVCDSIIHPKVVPLQYLEPTTTDLHQPFAFAEESNITEELMESESSEAMMAHDEDSSQSIMDQEKMQQSTARPLQIEKHQSPKTAVPPIGTVRIISVRRVEPERPSDEVVLLSEGNESDGFTDEAAVTPRVNLAKIEALEGMSGEKSDKMQSQQDSIPHKPIIVTAIKTNVTALPQTATTTSQIVVSQNTAAPVKASSSSSSHTGPEEKVIMVHTLHAMEKHRMIQEKEMMEMNYDDDDSDDIEDEEDFEEGEEFYEGRGNSEEEEIEEAFDGAEDEEEEEGYDEENFDEEEIDEDEEEEPSDIPPEGSKPAIVMLEKLNSVQNEVSKNESGDFAVTGAELSKSEALVNDSMIVNLSATEINQEGEIFEETVEENELSDVDSAPEVEPIAILSTTSLAESKNAQLLQETWHSDENGLLESETSQDIKASKSHLVDISDCPSREENVLLNEPAHLIQSQNNAVETIESPASIVRSEAGLALECALEQVETIDSLHATKLDQPNNDVMSQVRVVPIKEKRGNSDYPTTVPKRKRVEEEEDEESKLPTLHVMQEAFDSCSKDD